MLNWLILIIMFLMYGTVTGTVDSVTLKSVNSKQMQAVAQHLNIR
jgi:hypothetical protein